MPRRSARAATVVALLIVAVLIGVSIRSSIFTAWGADSAGYIGAGQLWSRGDLFKPASLVFWAPWASDGRVEAPLGHRVGPIKGTVVGEYPPGYPLLLAAAFKLGGELAPHVVAPLFAGLLSWCAFLLASRLGTPWGGVMACALVAVSPVTLFQATQPMSDVPAAALWMLGLVLASRPGMKNVVGAGLACAAAITVRPNLAPLAMAIAVVAVASHSSGGRRPVRLAAFAVVAAFGPALILWSQAVLYGHPLTPGYPGYRAFFSVERIPVNAALYPALLTDLHTSLPLAGLVVPFVALRDFRNDETQRMAFLVAAALGAIIVINYLVFLPYLTYRGWDTLRFVLPALVAVMILFAVFLDRVRVALARRAAMLGILALVPFLLLMQPARDEVRYVFASAPGYRRVQLMGHYLREAAPANAAVLTFLQSGAVSVYTNRLVVRLDLIDPGSLDRVVDDLERRGYRPALLIDEFMESQGFRARFQGSRYQQLDWAPRAQFASPTRIWYFETADRERYHRGERWPVDTLNWPPAPVVEP